VNIDSGVDTSAYARFTRRVQGVYVDLIILLVITTGALVVAVAFASDNIGRVLGFTLAITWLLYEPLLVSLTGGTLGHRYCNIRVVDDRHGGNVNFFKAIVRVVLKTALGWISFIWMAATSRHQALHDLLTGSTVQIRDLTKAQSHHFARARSPLPDGAPSRIRRIFVVFAYVIVWTIFCLVIAVNVLSGFCLNSNLCSPIERTFNIALQLMWLAVCAVLVGAGWRGRLWGARIGTVRRDG
jgi:uncharacterized RDD family membrane protein YckC